MKCPKCGKEIEEKSRFCYFCGTEIQHDSKQSSLNRFVLPLILFLTVILILALSKQGGSYPKGMYFLYDDMGKTAATLSLRSNGTYELEDRQEYSDSASSSIVVFAHDFVIGNDGLQWSPIIKGKYTSCSEYGQYLLKDLLGGLYSSRENAVMFYTEDEVYLSSENDPEQVLIFVRPK